MKALKQKYALVTGASSGIGREYALQLAARGYGIVLVSNREEENRAVAELIAVRFGVPTHSLCLDLATVDAAAQLHAHTEALGIEVEVLVCNAGILLFGALTATSSESLATITALHCTTPMLLCRLYAADMQRRGKGYILLTSSATAWMPLPTVAAYASTKSFLHTLACALHFELRKYGISVTGVYPGAVDTPLYRLEAGWRRRLVRWGVMSTPQSVARRGLRALFRGRKSVTPGLFTKIGVGICRLAPAWLIRLLIRIPAASQHF